MVKISMCTKKSWWNWTSCYFFSWWKQQERLKHVGSSLGATAGLPFGIEFGFSRISELVGLGVVLKGSLNKLVIKTMLDSSAWHKLEVSLRNWCFLFFFFSSFLVRVSLYKKTIMAPLMNLQDAKTLLSWWIISVTSCQNLAAPDDLFIKKS